MAIKRTTFRQTETIIVVPQDIPAMYMEQIADLLRRYLNVQMTPSALVPYFAQAYSQFYLLTSADGRRVQGVRVSMCSMCAILR